VEEVEVVGEVKEQHLLQAVEAEHYLLWLVVDVVEVLEALVA